MNFGGPVWHASVASQLISVGPSVLFAIAADALRGVGDPTLGEWQEIGDHAVHVRRRVSDRERARVGGLDVVDVRGTPDAVARIDRMRAFLPVSMRARPAGALP